MEGSQLLPGNSTAQAMIQNTNATSTSKHLAFYTHTLIPWQHPTTKHTFFFKVHKMSHFFKIWDKNVTLRDTNVTLRDKNVTKRDKVWQKRDKSVTKTWQSVTSVTSHFQLNSHHTSREGYPTYPIQYQRVILYILYILYFIWNRYLLYIIYILVTVWSGLTENYWSQVNQQQVLFIIHSTPRHGHSSFPGWSRLG